MENQNNKSNKGRKSSKNLDVDITHKMISRGKAIKGKEVLTITFESMDAKPLEIMILTQFLASKGVSEDSAGKILHYIWRNSEKFSGDKENSYFFGKATSLAHALDVSKLTVQKILKKMVEEGILELSEPYNAYSPSGITKSFLKSLEGDNKELVLSYRLKEEEQLDIFNTSPLDNGTKEVTEATEIDIDMV